MNVNNQTTKKSKQYTQFELLTNNRPGKNGTKGHIKPPTMTLSDECELMHQSHLRLNLQQYHL